jgi:DNA-binding GntR family transcriptional regulator
VASVDWDRLVADLRVAAHDRDNPLPLWARVAGGLNGLVESEQLPVGTRIETEVTLAERLGISRPTLRRAMQELVAKGVLVRKPGFGTQVVSPAVHRPIALTSLYDDLEKSGRAPHTEVLAFDVVPASDTVALTLRVPARSEVTMMRRLRYSNGEPLALLMNTIPTDVARFTRADLQKEGLYALLRKVGAQPRTANEVIGARVASAEEAHVLGIKRAAAVLTMSRSAWGVDGRGIEYGSHIYRADRYAFEQSVSLL